VMELQQAREPQGIRVLQVAPVPQEFQDKLPIRAQREIQGNKVRRGPREILVLLVISALLVILVPQAPRVAKDKQQTRARLGRLVRQDRLV
jgi:hypothetical protein